MEKNINNSSISSVFGRWPQTKMEAYQCCLMQNRPKLSYAFIFQVAFICKQAKATEAGKIFVFWQSSTPTGLDRTVMGLQNNDISCHRLKDNGWLAGWLAGWLGSMALLLTDSNSSLNYV